MNTFIQEEVILQNILLIVFGLGFVVACITEYIQRKQELDEISQLKLKKIFKFAYNNIFWNESKEERKQKTISLCKEIQRKRLINEKYDLIKGA
jgi:hypothetical protein